MTKDQNADHAYHEMKLIQLLIRRHNLPRTSDQIPALTLEITNAENLVRAYRMVKALSA